MRTLSRVMAMALFAAGCHGRGASNPEAPPDAGGSASSDGPATSVGDIAFVDAVAGQRTCSPLPEKLLEIQRGFTAVAVDREDIFVLGTGVQRISRFGPLDSVPMGGRLGNDMVVAGNDIIWSEDERLGGGGWAPVLYKTERGLGQTPQRLTDVSQVVVGKFAVRGAHIYFHAANGLARIDKDGRGYVPNVVSGEVYSFSLDDDGQFVFWSNAVGVWRQSLAEATSPSLPLLPSRATLLEAAPPPEPKLSRPILIFGNDATHVYSRIDEGDDFVVMRTPKAGEPASDSASPASSPT